MSMLMLIIIVYHLQTNKILKYINQTVEIVL